MLDVLLLLRARGTALTIALCAPTLLAAQSLDPVAPPERCDGQVITHIEFVRTQRELLSPRLDPVAQIVNQTLFTLQPVTRVRLLERFLLFRAGERCDEQRRVESERVLRAQSYISDVAIRVVARDAAGVRLRVETIDEYVLYSEAWGVEGLPAGVEVGTGSVGGTGKGFRVLAELGRGSEIGWGTKFKDPQFLGRPIIFDAMISSRPYVDSWALGLARPAYTNFQRGSWGSGLSSNRGFYTLFDTAQGSVTVEYERRTANASGSWRLGAVNAPWFISSSFEWERAQRRRVVQIRDDGPVDIPPPAPVESRYPAYDATRIGAGVSYRRVRFMPVRGLGALSAPEDIALGHDTWANIRIGIPAWQRDPADHVLSLGNSGAVGTDRALVRWNVAASMNTTRAGAPYGESSIGGRTTLALKRSVRHLTSLSVAATNVRNARIPTQFTFRDDVTGLIGYRSSNAGGAGRLIVSAEQRHVIPLTTRRAEVAVAALSQAGRLWAGDAPFGVTTPWRMSVGLAVMVAVPAGAKQMLRAEIGFPIDPPPGLPRRDILIIYGDRTGRY